jgi:6-pyruvoyltetrahydropterin/6-carboxytetrahydropterin synthase
MHTILKDFQFSASHQLSGLRDDHPCARLHGHNFIVRVVLERHDLDDVGFVMDYGDLAPLKDWLDATFDHRHLNDMMDCNPTAENCAHLIFDWCAAQGWPVSEVGWSETPKTWAYYRP